MDIGAWLRDWGLERYANSFEAHAIDAEVLAELTEADLEKLGVLLGHRKKLLKAIAALREPDKETAGARRGWCFEGAAARGRAAAVDCAVLRPSRLDRARGAARSRGHGSV